MDHNALSRKRFLNLEDLSRLPRPVWAIEGVFERNSLVMLAGPSKSFKSFLAIDWALCLAAGRKWCNKLTHPSKVLYVLGEGKSSLLKRLEAWMVHYNPSAAEKELLDSNFRVSWEVPQLASKTSVDNMLAQLNTEGFTPEVIVIDTFARSFEGLDENSSKDTGLWIASADRLRQLGYTVIFLHHTNKNTEFGVTYRGSTAIMGAMDTAMTMVRDSNAPNQCVVTITKQKDHEEGPPMRFTRVIVSAPGDPEGSLVLAPLAVRDDSFDPQGENDRIIREVMEDTKYSSDWERARALGPLLNISDNAAHTRIVYRRKQPKT